MKLFFFGLVLVLTVSGANPSYADIDHLCLKRCVEGGRNSSACLGQCAYEAVPNSSGSAAGGVGGDAGVPRPDAAAVQGHNVFAVPVPLGNQVVLPVSQAPVRRDENYACLMPCVKAGGPYDMCAARCVRKPCPQGADLCNTLPAGSQVPAGVPAGGGTSPYFNRP
jgi:hypothetical protein